MKRLTRKDKDGNVMINIGFGPMEVYDRLAHYEDLEEQGRLVELPCKVGDTVYVPDRNNKKILKKEVRQVSFNHHGKWLVFVGCIVVDVEEFGKTVFLSRAEAEAALAPISSQKGGLIDETR